MRDLWPTVKDALLLIPFLIIGGAILSQFFGGGVVTGIIALTAILSLLGRRRQRRTGPEDATNDPPPRENTDTDAATTDSPGPDVEPQSQAYSFNDADEPREPRNRTGLRRSNDEILEEAGTKLRNLIEIYDDGTIKLTAYDDLNLYSQFMLYVIAKRLAYEDQIADTPDVTGDELLNRFGYTKVDLMLFLDEAGARLTPIYSMGYRTGNIDYATIEDIEIRVEVRDLADITDWTVDEQQTSQWRMQTKIGHAMTALGEARDAYDNADDRHQPQTREEIGRHVKNACEAVQQYPVEIGYDGHWKTFSQYAEALLDFLEDDLAEKVDHCVPRMERALRNMDEQAEAETLF